MPCTWEGSRRSGVALAMRHRLRGVPIYGLSGLGKGDERSITFTTFHWSTTATTTMKGWIIVGRRKLAKALADPGFSFGGQVPLTDRMGAWLDWPPGSAGERKSLQRYLSTLHKDNVAMSWIVADERIRNVRVMNEWMMSWCGLLMLIAGVEWLPPGVERDRLRRC